MGRVGVMRYVTGYPLPLYTSTTSFKGNQKKIRVTPPTSTRANRGNCGSTIPLSTVALVDRLGSGGEICGKVRTSSLSPIVVPRDGSCEFCGHHSHTGRFCLSCPNNECPNPTAPKVRPRGFHWGVPNYCLYCLRPTASCVCRGQSRVYALSTWRVLWGRITLCLKVCATLTNLIVINRIVRLSLVLVRVVRQTRVSTSVSMAGSHSFPLPIQTGLLSYSSSEHFGAQTFKIPPQSLTLTPLATPSDMVLSHHLSERLVYQRHQSERSQGQHAWNVRGNV